MGAGASVSVMGGVQATNSDDLAALARGLDRETRAKLAAALAENFAEQAPMAVEAAPGARDPPELHGGSPSEGHSSAGGTPLMGGWGLLPEAPQERSQLIEAAPKERIELIDALSQEGVVEWNMVAEKGGSHQQLAAAIEKEAAADSPLLVKASKRSPMLFDTKDDALEYLKACDLAKSIDWKDVLKTEFGDEPIDIDETRKRGLRPTLLRRIIDFAAFRCGEWKDVADVAYSATAGEQLEMSFLNLYQLNDWVIMPSTSRPGCSMVELVSATQQDPTWFVTHWWGQPVANFVMCVEHHVHVRMLDPESIGYWVCAYSNRQHDLALEVPKDPKKTSFYLAMLLADGILVILNDSGNAGEAAVAFSRVWCQFEEAMMFDIKKERKFLYDISTTAVDECGREAHLLADGGPTALDISNAWTLGEQLSEQARRESSFPVSTLKIGLTAKIEDGEATREIDKTRILNCIAKREHSELDLAYLKGHPSYEEVDDQLHALVAVAAWPQAAQVEGLVAEMDLSGLLRRDTKREELSLCLANRGYCEVNEIAQALRALHGLRTLQLDLRNAGITSVDDLGEALKALKWLRELTLCLETTQIDSIDNLGEGFTYLNDLTTLTLKASGTRIYSVEAIGEGFKALKNLTALTLEFDSTEIDSVETLGKGFEELTNLTKLHLDLTGTKIDSVEAIGKGLKALTNLRALWLSLRQTNIDANSFAVALAGAVEALATLTSVDVWMPDGADDDWKSCFQETTAKRAFEKFEVRSF